MFDFLKPIFEKQEAVISKARDAAGRYRELLTRGVNGPALTAAERKELAEMTERLNYTAQQVEQDAQVIADYAAKKALGDTVKDKLAALKAMKAELAEHVKYFEAKVAEMTQTTKTHEGIIHVAGFELQSARQAQDKAQALERKHWQLLGKPAPRPVPSTVPTGVAPNPGAVDHGDVIPDFESSTVVYSSSRDEHFALKQ